jgi:hypothetical protein
LRTPLAGMHAVFIFSFCIHENALKRGQNMLYSHFVHENALKRGWKQKETSKD